MTKTQINKYIKANQACKKFLKASYGVGRFLTTILANLNCGKIKKVQNSFSKVQEFLSPEDYNNFKMDVLSFKGHFLDDSKDLVAKWEDIFTEYFKK